MRLSSHGPQAIVRQPAMLAAARTIIPARLGADVANVAVVGDSHIEGHGSTSWFTRFPNAMGRALGQKGSHIVFGSINAFADKPVTFAGNAGTVDQGGVEGRGWAARNAIMRDSTGTITFTFTGDAFDLVWVRYPGGPTLNVVIDGGAPATINTDGTLHWWRVWQSPGLSSGTHTVVISRPGGGTNYGYVNGAMTYNGDRTSGVRVWDGGHAGYTTLDYESRFQHWADGAWAIDPDLLLVCLGSNDITQARSVAATTDDLEDVVDLFLSMTQTPCSVALTMPSRHGAHTQQAWDDMVVAFRARAALRGWLWVDTTEALPSPGTPGSMYSGDNTHLTAAGQAMHAHELLRQTSLS